MQTDRQSLQQEAVQTLGFIADAVRYQADIVRFALGVGIPKQQIHSVTGLARTTIDRIAVQTAGPAHPCDYCLSEHYRQARHGEPAQPILDCAGYLLYRVGSRPEIVAQKLCPAHRDYDWDQRLPASARLAWIPHQLNTPAQIVYSLGGLRDDSALFTEYFSRFPEWTQKIAPLLAFPEAERPQ